MLPDADVILFRFGATYDSVWAHRGFTHSIGFAILLGVIALLLLRKIAPPLMTFAFVAFAAASHGFLDMLTNGGHGIAYFWPVSDQRYFFDWRPIQVSPLAPGRFMTKATAVAKSELIWVWTPAVALTVLLRSWFGRPFPAYVDQRLPLSGR